MDMEGKHYHLLTCRGFTVISRSYPFNHNYTVRWDDGSYSILSKEMIQHWAKMDELPEHMVSAKGLGTALPAIKDWHYSDNRAHAPEDCPADCWVRKKNGQ